MKTEEQVIKKKTFVIVRADRAGVFFGQLEAKNGQEVKLSNARKLHYWDGAAAVEEIAMIGTKKPDQCRFTVVVPLIVIDGVIQVIPCSDVAVTAIKNVKEWKA